MIINGEWRKFIKGDDSHFIKKIQRKKHVVATRGLWGPGGVLSYGVLSELSFKDGVELWWAEDRGQGWGNSISVKGRNKRPNGSFKAGAT